jgi:hypothetical protein
MSRTPSRLPRLTTVAAALLVALLGAAPVAAATPLDQAPRTYSAGGDLHVVAMTIRLAGPASASAIDSTDPCKDPAYHASGGRWYGPYRWSFNAASTPAGLGRHAAEDALKRAFRNIVTEHNDCGRPDRVSATQTYLGVTAVRPNIDASGRCTSFDGHNVIGFGRLPGNVSAYTCWWVQGGSIVEADMRINSAEPWATSLVGCSNQFMLEAVATHEAGHVFGLMHVREARHPHLTMSTFLDGACENGESTLGLGDMLGLESTY